MKLKILLCDDDAIFLDKLKCDITSYFSKTKHEINIIKKNNDFESIQDTNFDIVFIDIDLAQTIINGIDVASFIKQKNPKTLIIFVSARNELVFDTFKVGGFQFIRKNNYQHDFTETMLQLDNYLIQNSNNVAIDINGRIRKIQLNKIKYIMAIGHEINIFCYDQHTYLNSSINKVLTLLNYPKLVQIQKSFVVNLDYVDDFVKWKIKCENKEYKIGRVYQENFLNAYESYLLNDNVII